MTTKNCANSPKLVLTDLCEKSSVLLGKLDAIVTLRIKGLLTPISDQDRISRYNINTTLSRVIRIKTIINWGIIS